MNLSVKPVDLGLRLNLLELYERYASLLNTFTATRNGSLLDEWTEFFAENALYRVISRENYEQGLPHATLYCAGRPMIVDRAAAIRDTAVFEPRLQRHFISGLEIVSASGDDVEARANFLVTECKFDGEPEILMVGQYLDRLTRQADGRWLFADRAAVFDNYRVRTTLVIPV